MHAVFIDLIFLLSFPDAATRWEATSATAKMVWSAGATSVAANLAIALPIQIAHQVQRVWIRRAETPVWCQALVERALYAQQSIMHPHVCVLPELRATLR